MARYVAISLAWSGMICAVVYFGLFGQANGIAAFINADTLLAPHMAWDVIRHSYALANFQWPRIASPLDMAFFFAADLAGMNWRWSVLAYTAGVAIASGLAAAWILSRLWGASAWQSAPTGLAIIALTLAINIAVMVEHGGSINLWLPPLFLFHVLMHGNVLLLSSIATVTGVLGAHGNRRMAALTYVLCFLGAFSDALFLTYFLTPFAVAGLAFARQSVGIERLLLFLAKAFLSSGVGWLAHQPLPRQELGGMWPGLGSSLGALVTELPRVPWIVLCLVLSAAVLVRTLRREHDPQQRWLIYTGLFASALSFALAALLYLNANSYRYALPLLWWPPILATGTLLRSPSSRTQLAMLAAALTSFAFLPLSTGKLPGWRDELERCVSAQRSELGLRAGLASYWVSRVAMASSNWTLQVDQIGADGRAFVWGSNMAANRHDMLSPGQPPFYNFLLVDRYLDPAILRTVYGSPTTVAKCAGADIWVYGSRLDPSNQAGGGSVQRQVERGR